MLGAVDTFMLSRYSDNSVAAVGVVYQIIMLAFLVFEVINLGTSVLCSQYLGAKMQKNVVQVVGVSLLFNLLFGLPVSALLHFGSGFLLGVMGLRPELMQEGKSYMEIVGAFAFFQALSRTISASLRSANKAIYPMMVTVVVNILNILGNYSLIFGKFGFPLRRKHPGHSLRTPLEQQKVGEKRICPVSLSCLTEALRHLLLPEYTLPGLFYSFYKDSSGGYRIAGLFRAWNLRS